MRATAELAAYAERHFVPLDELAALAAATTERVGALIDARAIPGPIYSIWPNGAFWSPIGGAHGGAPAGTPSHWYTPAAAWWIRLAGDMDPAIAAETLQARFRADFVRRLASDPDAALGYPQACREGRPSADLAATAADSEWNDWIDGGYGVCLRQWNAYHAITKTCRRAAILAITDEGRAETLPRDHLDTLIEVLAELESVMLPFAPHQRPHGTPGLWLDAMLDRYGLGRMRETTVAASPARLCA